MKKFNTRFSEKNDNKKLKKRYSQMKKRALALGMCAVMALSVTACGKSNTNSDSDSDNVGKIGTEGNSNNSEAVMTGTDYKAKVTLPDYASMTVGEELAAIDELDVKRIDCLLMVSQYFDVDMTNIGQKQGTVSEYDIVNIDYVGKLDGEPFDNGSAQGYNLGIGTGSFIDGFEDGLIGVQTGETVDLNLKFPDGYQQNTELAGKDVVFTVTVNYINEVTDEFVVDNREVIIYLMYQYFSAYQDYATAEEYYSAIRQGLKVFNVVSGLFQKIKDDSVVERDEAELAEFIADQKQPYIESAELNEVELTEVIAAYYDFDTEEEFDEYIADIYDSYAVMFAIAKQENLEVSEEDYQRVAQAIVDSNPTAFGSLAAFQEQYSKQDTVDDMIFGRVYYRIADIVKVVPDDEATVGVDDVDSKAADGTAAGGDNLPEVE